MRVEEIQALLRAEPFMPLRIHVSDGAAYDVTDPRFVFLTRLHVEIGVDPDEMGIPRTGVYIDPMHVTRVTYIDGKGRKRRRR